MTALALDGRGPRLVVVGSFNPAIFSLTWVATNVFGIPEGAEMEVLEVIIQVSPQTAMRLSFINGVALNITPNRLELFAASTDATTHAALEAALDKILELLPHTPVSGIGCNFRWADTEPLAETMDLFDTPEGLEGQFEIVMRQFSTQLALDNAVLNFMRASSENEVQFSFNYHRNVADVEECRALLDGMISKDIEHSTAMMKDIYGYENFSTLGFVSEQQGELIDAAKTTD